MAPRRSFITLLLWVVCFYFLPAHALLADVFQPVAFALPTFGLFGLPDPLIMEANPGYAALLVLAYLLLYVLVGIALRLIRAYHWDEAIEWLATITMIKDLKGLDDLLIQLLPLAALGYVAAIPFWHTEATAVLLVISWLALIALRVGRKPQRVPAIGPRQMQSLPGADVPDGTVTKKYTWRFPERVSTQRDLPTAQFSVDLAISQARYQEFHSQPRVLDPRRWGSYVTAEIPEVDTLAGKLVAIGRDRGYRSYEQASNTLAFIQQCIRYAQDLSPDTAELIKYPKYPVETLIEEAGDREDGSILTAALLSRMDYDVALLIGPDHAALGVAGADGLPGSFIVNPITDRRYFYAENTGEGWILGELPDAIKGQMARGEYQIVRVIAPMSNSEG